MASDDHGPVRQLALSSSTSLFADSAAVMGSFPWSSETVRTVCSAPAASIACLIWSTARSDAFWPESPRALELPLRGSEFRSPG